MKTVVDVSAFLKRNPGAISMQHDGKVFIVKHGEMSARSQYLDDALESIAEETRRRANGMQTMRESKPEPVTPTSLPPQKYPYSPTPSISAAGQIAYQQQQAASTGSKINGAVPSCPTCGRLPVSVSGTGSTYCPVGHSWMIALSNGTYVVHADGSTATWNGTMWS